MDMPTLLMTLKKSSLESVLSQAKAYTDGKSLEEEMNIGIAYPLLLKAFREHIEECGGNGLVCEEGMKALSNSLVYPFNNSKASIALLKEQADIKYAVIADVASANGNAGEVIISDKQTNGFKAEYTGSAQNATVHYIVIGGLDL